MDEYEEYLVRLNKKRSNVWPFIIFMGTVFIFTVLVIVAIGVVAMR